MAAKKAGIPVILLDRNVDQCLAKAGRDYLTFIGSDFVDEGKRAAEWLAKASMAMRRSSSSRAPPAHRRPMTASKGFEDTSRLSGFKIVASPDRRLRPRQGPSGAGALLQAHPDATAIYAHNDEMAIGAIAALEAAGKMPGKD